jgi:hypothetical protein
MVGIYTSNPLHLDVNDSGLRNHRNITLIEVALYITTVFLFFKIGGYVSDLATSEVHLISIAGFIKLTAMLGLLIIITIVFVGPIVVIRDIAAYYKAKN